MPLCLCEGCEALEKTTGASSKPRSTKRYRALHIAVPCTKLFQMVMFADDKLIVSEIEKR